MLFGEDVRFCSLLSGSKILGVSNEVSSEILCGMDFIPLAISISLGEILLNDTFKTFFPFSTTNMKITVTNNSQI